MKNKLFRIQNLKRAFDNKVVLDIPDLTLPKGEVITIVGESGCGKTTLLELLGLMNYPAVDDPRYNEIEIDLSLGSKEYNYRNDLWTLEEDMAEVRKRHFSFLFQEANLFPNLDVEENIFLPSLIQEKVEAEDNHELDELFEQIGLEHRRYYNIKKLSVGQRQRTSFARGVFREHDILFADEPTGNLDPFNANKVFKLITSYVEREAGNTAIIVTHSLSMALKHSDRVIALTKDGYCDSSQTFYNEDGLWYNQSEEIGDTQDARDKVVEIVENRRTPEDIQESKSIYQKSWQKFEEFFGEKYKNDYSIFRSDQDGLNKVNFKAILTFLILLTGFCAIGFANGSLTDLARKMSDPFVNWLNIELTHEYRYNPDKLIQPLSKKSISKKYRINQISQFSQYSILIQDHKRKGSKFLKGRTIALNDQILDKLESEEFLLKGRMFSSPKDLGIIVEKKFFDKYGYSKNAQFISLIYSTEDKGEIPIPIPIRGVVKELPGNNYFLTTNYFKYELYHSKSIPRPFSPVNTEKLILYTPVSEKKAFNLKDSLRNYFDKSRKSLNKYNLTYIGNPQPYDRTWKKGYILNLNISNSPDLQDLQSIYTLLANRFESYNLTQFFNTNFDNRVKADFVRDRLSLNLSSIEKVFELKNYLERNFKITLDVAHVQLLKNFNRVKKITVTLSLAIIFFAIFSVTVFIFYHLYIDLYKRRVYLGSLKAFGLTKKRLEKYYTGQMLKFLGKITFLALVGAIIAGYSGMIREVWSLITNVETEALYFQLIDMNNMINIKNLYLLLFILFLFLGGYISVRFACKKILSISPGDLVKDRVE